MWQSAGSWSTLLQGCCTLLFPHEHFLKSWTRLFLPQGDKPVSPEPGHTGAHIILSAVNLPDHPPARAVLFGVQPLAKRSKTEQRKAESRC